MASGDHLIAGEASVWVQPGGPNTKPEFLGCHMVGDLAVPHGDTTLRYCPDPARPGRYVRAFSYAGEPGPVTVTITTFLKGTADWLEQVAEQGCPVAVYVHKTTCGRRDVFVNRVRSFVLYPASITNETFTGLASREPGDEAGTEYSTDISADEIFRPRSLTVARQAVAEPSALNDVAFCNAKRCTDTCGAAAPLGKSGFTGSDAPAGSPAAFADTHHTDDGGASWSTAPAHPFAAGEDIMSVACFQVSATATRKLVVREVDPADNLEVAYSDDDGETWTTVDVGVVNNQGALGPGALFALDMYHIWLVTGGGYVYFSEDGGATWTTQESGGTTSQNLWAVHFKDTDHGMAVGAAGAVIVTSDGGNTWTLATAPVSAILRCVGENGGGDIWWVGTAEGNLYYSSDFGTTWTRRSFSGDGGGIVHDLQFTSPLCGFMIHDTAGSVGTVFRTINGGYDWEPLTTPTNAGLNALWALNENLCYVVGEPSGGTAVIFKVSG